MDYVGERERERERERVREVLEVLRSSPFCTKKIVGRRCNLQNADALLRVPLSDAQNVYIVTSCSSENDDTVHGARFNCLRSGEWAGGWKLHGFCRADDSQGYGMPMN